eukprot:scaffold18914_cov107-Isochrysis_galbana.AAC.1
MVQLNGPRHGPRRHPECGRPAWGRGCGQAARAPGDFFPQPRTTAEKQRESGHTALQPAAKAALMANQATPRRTQKKKLVKP